MKFNQEIKVESVLWVISFFFLKSQSIAKITYGLHVSKIQQTYRKLRKKLLNCSS